MAGDWIKIEHATVDKPEVYEIAEILDLDPDAVIGKLLRIWIWADNNVTESSRSMRDERHADNVTDVTLISHGFGCRATRAVLNRLAGHDGFAEAMEIVGWLRVRVIRKKTILEFPNFDRHNGKPAKNRALATYRSQSYRMRQRHADTVTTVTKSSRSDRDDRHDDSVTREEIEKSLIKKEKSKKKESSQGSRLPPDWKPSKSAWTWAVGKIGENDAEHELERFAHYWHRARGARAEKIDWDATWRNWVRRSAADRPARGGRDGTSYSNPAVRAAAAAAGAEREAGEAGGEESGSSLLDDLGDLI